MTSPVNPAVSWSAPERPHPAEGAGWWLGSSAPEPEAAAAERLTTLTGLREAGL